MSRPVSISVVVPVFNAATTLPCSLAALRRELATEPGCELICVDNGSTDGSQEILRAVPGITHLHEPGQGAYAARNRGVSAARGHILAFTDPDCIVAEGWLRAVAETFRDETCLAALGLRRPAPDTGLNCLLGNYEAAKDRWVLSGRQPRKFYGFTNTMAVVRAAWDRFGPFEERPRGADTIFIRRLVDAAGCSTVKFVPAMRVSHLEINGPASYMRKAFIYGRSLQSYRRAVVAEPLTFRDRMQVFRSAAHGSGLIPSAALAALLAAGLASWAGGRLAGRLFSPTTAVSRPTAAHGLD